MYKNILFLFFLKNLSYAVSINNTMFSVHGGNINNANATYKIPYKILTKASLDKKFLSVGLIPGAGCTGTWLGDSWDGKYVIILTAAHCIPHQGLTGKTHLSFRDYKGWLVGQDGYYYVRSKIAYSSDEMYFRDVAILKLEKIRSIFDLSGKPIIQPILSNTKEIDTKKPVDIVGHGYWGTSKNGPQERWQPNNGPRRAWGQSFIESGSHPYYAKVNFSREGITWWAKSEVGDSGAAWWQTDENGNNYIVGVTHGGNQKGTYFTKISIHKDWIESVASEVKWSSDPNSSCWWLTYKENRWGWVPYEIFGNKKNCLDANKCKEGGGCYKWGVYP